MKKKGFTLIELLIVIAIIGILSAALLPTILNAPARGRDAARIGHLNQLVAALEAWNSDKGEYPETDGCIGLGTADGDPFGLELSSYFSGGNPPRDPQGERTLETPDDLGGCATEGLYYYNYLGIVNVADYILATKMELDTGNNTTTVPSSLNETSVAGPDGACDTDPETPCTYYILVK